MAKQQTTLLRLLILPALCAALLIGAACSGQTAHAPRDPGGPLIVATTGMVADIMRAVAGESADVRALMGPGSDPHLYTPTRADVALLMQADLIAMNGFHLEGRLGETLESIARHTRVIAVAELAPEDAVMRYSGAVDPHLWMDVQLWASLADPLAEQLAEWRPERAEDFRANARAWRESLVELDTLARQAVATIDPDRRVLITAHDAFGYFGRAYEIEVHGIQGLSTDSEAGLSELNALVDMIVTRRIPAIFVESSVPDKSVRALLEGARSRGHAVVIGGELFSDAMGPVGTPEGTYPGMMDHNITTIVRALGGQAPHNGFTGSLTPKGG